MSAVPESPARSQSTAPTHTAFAAILRAAKKSTGETALIIQTASPTTATTMFSYWVSRSLLFPLLKILDYVKHQQAKAPTVQLHNRFRNSTHTAYSIGYLSISCKSILQLTHHFLPFAQTKNQIFLIFNFPRIFSHKNAKFS